jgi:uncharacterized protein YndB with AHSA1/START domain
MTSITLVRRIGARPEIVFAALSTPEGIAHWWGPDAGPVLIAEIDARVGGRFRVRFRMLDGTEHEARGEYLEVVYCKRLVMTWQWTFGACEPEERGKVSRVVIDLRPIDSGTELTFTHEQLQTEISCNSHKWGWSGALDKLERYLSTESEVVATP